MSASVLHVEDFSVGWISAILSEYVVACQLLDIEYNDAPIEVPDQDNNAYTYGRIGSHNVVIACLPKGRYGTTSAAYIARDMHRTFPRLRFGLMVGIGGGAPSDKHDIRLGDVVVSTPARLSGGVIQYDHGKAIQNRSFELTGMLDKPPIVLLNAMQKLHARHERWGHNITQTINTMMMNAPRLAKTYSKPDLATDVLYNSSFVHSDNRQPCSSICIQHVGHIVEREVRDTSDDDPYIHYGLIASADRLMKDATMRDRLTESEGVLCFEMEAAGLMDGFPCLIIRGVSDYSDTHKNDHWQGYAAACATAYAKELLQLVPSREHTVNDIVSNRQRKNRRPDPNASSAHGKQWSLADLNDAFKGRRGFQDHKTTSNILVYGIRYFRFDDHSIDLWLKDYKVDIAYVLYYSDKMRLCHLHPSWLETENLFLKLRKHRSDGQVCAIVDCDFAMYRPYISRYENGVLVEDVLERD